MGGAAGAWGALCPLLLVSATRLPNKTRPQSKTRHNGILDSVL